MEAGAISDTPINQDTLAPGPGHNQPIEGVRHDWPVRRRARSLRVGILEPAAYQPTAHAELFTKVITRAIEPMVTGLDVANDAPIDETYDLLVCPEAFLPQKTLLDVLAVIETQSQFPCVHVGLRPNAESATHLFSYNQLRTLVDQLRALGDQVHDDLRMFSGWLDGASRTGFYNVACVFMVDVHGALRVGLHPKNTPSSLEVSALPDRNVAQADFTTVVTLAPVDGAFFSVNIQPLICSDALDLQRDTHRPGPMAVLASNPERVGPGAPEHIDIVSVVTCTPQKNEGARGEAEILTWQPKFREMFVETMEAAALDRHRDAMVVLANPRRIERKPAGLSGCFVPLPLPEPLEFGPAARAWSYGRVDRKDNGWLPVSDSNELKHRWSSLGHLVAVDADSLDTPTEDCLITFTIPALPRNRPKADRTATVSAFQVHCLGRITSPDDSQQGDAHG